MINITKDFLSFDNTIRTEYFRCILLEEPEMENPRNSML